MFPFINIQAVKPNRLTTPNKDTNEKYHSDYANFCIGLCNTAKHSEWNRKTFIHKEFYKNKQWGNDEDIEGFLKDDTGQTRNRIEVTHNIVRPMIEQYRGNAIRMTINVAAKPMSIKAVNRRELKLAEQLFYTDLANQVDSYSNYIRKRYNVGKDKDETKKIFDNTYVDALAQDITELVKEIARRNEFSNMQIKLAENIAFSGLGVMEGYEYGGQLKYEVVPSETFIWDTEARRDDLQDADFMGKYQNMIPTDIYENWQVSKEKAEAIEKYVSSADSRISEYNIGGGLSTRVPVFSVYWRDCDEYEYGYVKDEWGYDYLTRINYTEPGEDKPKYTDADLITPPRSPKNDKLFKGGKKKRKLRVDTLRYCIFIPAGVLAVANTMSNVGVSDVILEYGLYPYQDTQLSDPCSVKYPFKCHAWSYVDGEVLSPVDDIINPQRFINRILSAMESQINNSGGTNIVYDADSVDAQDGEDELLRNIQQGKPAKVRSRGQGIPNTVSVYDATPKQGTYNMFSIVSSLKQITQDTTGVNEALKGESTGSDQLVGVTQLLLQRGSLMQEPFYFAISDIFMQCHQYSANVGKRIYLENEYELAIMVGDEGVKVLKLSEDLNMEDFRIFVERQNSDEILTASADQMLLTLRQLNLIDDNIVANLYGRSTPSDVGRFLRQFSRDKIEAARLSKAQEQEQLAVVEGKLKEQQAVAQNIDQYRRAEDFTQQRTLQADKNEGKLMDTLAKTLMSGGGK